MTEKKETISFDDKEKIKEAVLMSVAKQDLDAEVLAEQACKAIGYINSYQESQNSN